MQWLKRPQALALTLALAAQIAVVYGLARGEKESRHVALAGLPRSVNGWTVIQEGVVEKAIRDAIGADDLLSRQYRAPDGRVLADLFVAYFDSQRTGAVPHSPKHCLPAGGWTPAVSDVISITVPGRAQPIRVNRYLVSRGEARSVVLYWFQSHGRVIASEFDAKVHLVAGAIRYRRSDTALVRVVVPVAGISEQRATDTATAFVQAVFGTLAPFVTG